MKTIDPLEVYLSEIDYSCSPGGINQWEMSIYSQDHNNYFSGFDNVSQAIEMLMAHYPNRELSVRIKSKDWYYANEEREQMLLDKLNTYTKDAKGIAWDNCHKIYVLMDDEQMDIMRNYGYDPLITADEMTAEQMSEQLIEWLQNSCSLRFIQAVKDNDFTDVVSQFELAIGEEGE